MTDKLAEVREQLALTDEEMENIGDNIACSYIGHKAENAQDGDLEKEVAKAMAENQQDKDFNTPIRIEGGKCPIVGCYQGKIPLDSHKFGPCASYSCPTCKGTGKLPDKTKTIKQLIEEAMK